ncbi:MAG: hypothetical protein BWK77_07610 [Verrucomicrobia bacterium A1]|nr:MAG: hypothetical protein BWK77_07610 [Verrucomicrobia bacterium A1]
MKGKNTLVWETCPAPANARGPATYSVTWHGGMGYFAEPPGSFELYVDGAKALDIPAISEKDATWSSPDGTVVLKYARAPLLAESGVFTLSMPSSRVTPGRPLRLKAVGSDANSRRWFGVYSTPGSEPRTRNPERRTRNGDPAGISLVDSARFPIMQAGLIVRRARGAGS